MPWEADQREVTKVQGISVMGDTTQALGLVGGPEATGSNRRKPTEHSAPVVENQHLQARLERAGRKHPAGALRPSAAQPENCGLPQCKVPRPRRKDKLAAARADPWLGGRPRRSLANARYPGPRSDTD